MTHIAAVLASETRSEVLKAIRLPAFLVPVITFPAMFYLLFGVLIPGRTPVAGLTKPAYLLATYGTFGIVGAALFGMGVGVAVERGQGWFTLKRATPMPPLAYFGAKTLMSMLIGGCVVLLIATLGVLLGDVVLPASSWALLVGVLVLGAVPFCAMGCAIGFTAGPNSAPVIANLVYLPISVASGLWIPIEFLPGVLQRIALWLPPYHVAQLALGAIQGTLPSPVLHFGALAAATILFLGIAVLAYRYGNDRTWG